MSFLMSPSLSIVSQDDAQPSNASLSDQIKRLQVEAKSLAGEHVRAFEASLRHIQRMAAEIAVGGDAYPVGVREVARGLAEDCRSRIETLGAISARN